MRTVRGAAGCQCGVRSCWASFPSSWRTRRGTFTWRCGPQLGAARSSAMKRSSGAQLPYGTLSDDEMLSLKVGCLAQVPCRLRARRARLPLRVGETQCFRAGRCHLPLGHGPRHGAGPALPQAVGVQPSRRAAVDQDQPAAAYHPHRRAQRSARRPPPLAAVPALDR